MIQLPALRRGNAAAKLERANGELAKCEASIVELKARLSALDPESDDYQSVAQTIGAQISVQEKALSILSIQVAGLEAKVELEERAAAKARRQVAVKKAETELLPQYLAAVDEHAAALLGPRATKAKLIAARDAIAKAWPVADLELPFLFYLDVSRADRALRATVAADDATAKEIAADFVAYECKLITDLINSWKAPLPPIEDEKAA